MSRIRQCLFLTLAIACVLVIVLPNVAIAADEKPTPESVNASLTEKAYDLDTVWTLLAAFLVMWMQAGFAAVEAGFTRAKNAVNIIMKNLMDFSLGSLAFFAVGFAIMFSISGNSATDPYFGSTGFFLTESEITVTGDDGATSTKSNFDPISWTNVPLTCKFFFQLVFAATAATIVSGAMAERTKFSSYLLYSVIISLIIYPVSGHWIWGGGWLASLREVTIDGEKTMTGMWDFAGSTVVHSVGGWLALVGALVVGPRIGKYGSDGKPNAIPGHNIPFAALGVFILWLGWFGFNPGSTMGAIRNDIAHIVCTTNMAAAAGAVSALALAKILFKKWDSGMALNGVLAGLVAITAPCAWVTISSSIWIGLLAGVLVVLSILFFDRIAKIDDPVGAISVHGVCGAFGTLAVGLFADQKTLKYAAGPMQGLLVGGDAGQLINQAIGVGAVFLWCIATGLILFLTLRFTVGLRVSAEEEIAGLDVGEHGNDAYYGFEMLNIPAEHTRPSAPRPAAVPPSASDRFNIIIDGVDAGSLSDVWSDLCQPDQTPPSADFLTIYPHMTTLQGNRMRFKGGDPGKVKGSLERLLKEKLRANGLRVVIETA